jgi:hypothetical protein
MANTECQRCHRVFQRMDSENVCPGCAPLDEMDFKRIKEYLEQHQGASSTEVMRETGVSLNQIRRYLKEDRLEIVGDNKGFIRCEKCGVPVNSGRYCDGCYKEEVSRKMVGVKVNKEVARKGSDKHKYLKE